MCSWRAVQFQARRPQQPRPDAAAGWATCVLPLRPRLQRVLHADAVEERSRSYPEAGAEGSSAPLWEPPPVFVELVKARKRRCLLAWAAGAVANDRESRYPGF